MIPRRQSSRVGAISCPLAELNLSRDLLCIIANMAELVFGTEVTIFHYSSLYEQIWSWFRTHSKEEGSMQSALLTVSVTKLF